MIKVRLSGYSDDIVNVQFIDGNGDVVREEELTHQGDTLYVAVSDGTVIAVDFTSDWIMRKKRDGEGDCEIRKVEEDHQVVASDDDEEAIITIDENKAWIVAGDRFEKGKIEV